MRRLSRVLLPAVVVTALAAAPRAATITLAPGTQYQTVDGLGGTSSRIVAWKYKLGPFY